MIIFSKIAKIQVNEIIIRTRKRVEKECKQIYNNKIAYYTDKYNRNMQDKNNEIVSLKKQIAINRLNTHKITPLAGEIIKALDKIEIKDKIEFDKIAKEFGHLVHTNNNIRKELNGYLKVIDKIEKDNYKYVKEELN